MLQAKILTRSEAESVLTSLRAAKNKNGRLNLMVVVFSLCCGLRRRELVGLNMGDVQLEGPRPLLHVRKEVGKGKRQRWVPLWWDSGSLADIKSWIEWRWSMGAGPDDPVLCSLSKSAIGKRLTHNGAYLHWRTAIKCLGKERQRQLHIHCGRHSFASHYAYVGRSLTEIREALGHRNIATTSIYLGLLEREGVKDGFGFGE